MRTVKLGFIICDSDEYKQLSNLPLKPVESFDDCGFFGDKFLLDKENIKFEVITICCGIGKVNAASCAMYLIHKGVKIIFNAGFSGGFSNTTKGSIVIGDKFIEHDFDLTPLGYKPSEKPGQESIWYADSEILKSLSKFYSTAKVGTFVTGDSFICSDEKGRELTENFGAIACDMESAAIASVCSRASIPFASVRLISDGGNNESVSTYFDTVNQGLSDCLLPLLIFEWISKEDTLIW